MSGSDSLGQHQQVLESSSKPPLRSRINANTTIHTASVWCCRGYTDSRHMQAGHESTPLPRRSSEQPNTGLASATCRKHPIRTLQITASRTAILHAKRQAHLVKHLGSSSTSRHRQAPVHSAYYYLKIKNVHHQPSTSSSFSSLLPIMQ